MKLFVKHILIVWGLTLMLMASGLSQVYVNVTSPNQNATVGSPFTINAYAQSNTSIAGWHIYDETRDAWAGPAQSNISASISLGTGPHSLAIRAWDANGAFSTYFLTVNVGASSALPTPPSTARVFDYIDQMSGWGSCGSSWCAGGSGRSVFWQALYQGNPSMDGSSMEVFNSGYWANALWWRHLGANNWATNMLWDFWVYLDGASQNYTQALEYDSFQFVGGWNYMVGTQCNYATGTWDTWNEQGSYWIHNYSVPCWKFSPYSWHHVQEYVTLDHYWHRYTYKTIVVDGRVYNLNQSQPAKYVGWGDNLGAQWQIDINGSGGGVHEWVDKAKLTIW